MTRYLEFCDSLRDGRAKAQEEQLVREDKERILPQDVAEIVGRLCAYYQCPEERVRYIDARSGIATSPLGSGSELVFSDDLVRHCGNLFL